jgi:heterodisulfide reductase subunit B
MQIAYYPGCSLKQSSALYDRQVRLVLKRLGFELKELQDWNCCGATSVSKTDDFMAVAMPARNLGLASQDGLQELLIPCSACYSRTLVAKHYLQTHKHLKEDINAELTHKINIEIKILSILEVLLRSLETGELEQKLQYQPQDLKPVCYYGCLLTRFPWDVPVPEDLENPTGMERIIQALGLVPIDWNYKTNCCGASAAVTDPQSAYKLMAEIMQDALDRGANCIVATCPMCQMNLDAYQNAFCEQEEISQRLPVYFLTEILGLALGFSIKELQIDRHFIHKPDLVREFKQYESSQ